LRIVLIEDNVMLASGIRKALQDDGHSIEMFTDGTAADRYLEFEGADIAIIDINLPGMDGITLTRRLRQRKQTFPVIMLTANSETPDRVKGLDAGADDYLIKPFAMAELEARIRALSRRRPELAPDHETIGKLTLSRSARRLFHSETQEEIDLSRRELVLFETLLERQGQFISKSSLADTLYGVGADVEMNAVELQVSRLRRHLKGCGIAIRTARGIGYMLEPEATA
jgi:two-component system OmpR family response regulator